MQRPFHSRRIADKPAFNVIERCLRDRGVVIGRAGLRGDNAVKQENRYN